MMRMHIRIYIVRGYSYGAALDRAEHLVSRDTQITCTWRNYKTHVHTTHNTHSNEIRRKQWTIAQGHNIKTTFKLRWGKTCARRFNCIAHTCVCWIHYWRRNYSIVDEETLFKVVVYAYLQHLQFTVSDGGTLSLFLSLTNCPIHWDLWFLSCLTIKCVRAFMVVSMAFQRQFMGMQLIGLSLYRRLFSGFSVSYLLLQI